jgi:hypothetical protein
MPDAADPTPASPETPPFSAPAANAAAGLVGFVGQHDDLPPTLRLAGRAIGITAVAAILLGIAQKPQFDWAREGTRKAVARNHKLTMPSDNQIRTGLTYQLIALILVGVLIGLLARQVLRGKSSARGWIFATWALATIGLTTVPGLPYLGLPTAIAFIFSGAPVAVSALSLVAALGLFGGFVLVMLPDSRRFYAANKIAAREAAEALTESGAGVPYSRPSLLSTLFRPTLPRRPANGRPASGSRPPRPVKGSRPARASRTAPVSLDKSSAQESSAQPVAPARSKSKSRNLGGPPTR